jgi:hypothetical protein
MRKLDVVDELHSVIPSAPGIYVEKWKDIPDHLQPSKLGISAPRNDLDQSVVFTLEQTLKRFRAL